MTIDPDAIAFLSLVTCYRSPVTFHMDDDKDLLGDDGLGDEDTDIKKKKGDDEFGADDDVLDLGDDADVADDDDEEVSDY